MMPTGPRLDFGEACRALEMLTEHFKLRPITLVWRRKGRKGSWYFHGRRIVAGPNCRGIATIVHEVAHALADERAGRRVTHGPAFYTALKDVARAYYGFVEAYPWHEEYARISTWALREGIHTRPEEARAKLAAERGWRRLKRQLAAERRLRLAAAAELAAAERRF